MMSRKNLVLAALLLLSAGMSVLQVLVNLEGEIVAQGTEVLWGLVSLFLTVLWAYYDSERDGFKRPFDFGLIVILFWPIALPWYLIATRRSEGILVYLGFTLLWTGPWMLGLVTYVYLA